MKIGGLGDFDKIRKTMKKEETSKPSSPSTGSGESVSPGDEVQISGKAKMLGKLSQVPDTRQAEIERVRAKIADGTLTTPEAVKEGVTKLISNIIGGAEE
ncbi:MAG: flagellar biosynthesis anti-sigma factor FlgM [Planctomycetes bacterium]|nr:flagellar biosynthesis anti-sigma factor FlgM [Planctomycetota bacterium]